MTESYDVIIVGGGTAGCVLAARLTEEADRTVLLLEAGPDYRAADLPAHLADGAHGPDFTGHDWAVPGLIRGRAVHLPRGRVIGGSGAVNATFALRGSPHDYDGWGIPGWSFDDVLPDFIALETDLDHGGQTYHGDHGPVPVRRYEGDDVSPVAAGALDAMQRAGLPGVADHNAPYAVGAGPVPMNCVDGLRMSTALAYLEPARARGNLTIRGDSPVDEVVVRNGRATGVRIGAEVLTRAAAPIRAAPARGRDRPGRPPGRERRPALLRPGPGPPAVPGGRDAAQLAGRPRDAGPRSAGDRRWPAPAGRRPDDAGVLLLRRPVAPAVPRPRG
jgi:choline dehydrogenase